MTTRRERVLVCAVIAIAIYGAGIFLNRVADVDSEWATLPTSLVYRGILALAAATDWRWLREMLVGEDTTPAWFGYGMLGLHLLIWFGISYLALTALNRALRLRVSEGVSKRVPRGKPNLP